MIATFIIHQVSQYFCDNILSNRILPMDFAILLMGMYLVCVSAQEVKNCSFDIYIITIVLLIY